MEITAALNLDPERDFRFSDLRDADFSKADLRGFDFRGADLRGSYGINVTVDQSTNFADADLEGSCFATYYREFRLFKDKPMAGRMYRALLEGDPFEISAWLHERYRDQRERHSILKKADPATAAILCQKLLTDDVDLTKRTDLLYFLRSITSSPTELRELMLSILARQSENTSFIEKFTTVASSLHGSDPEVRGFILQLCTAESSRVRLAAFKASANIGIFLGNFESMRHLFMNRQNMSIRKELILESATHLGRNHLACVNRSATLDGVAPADVLDMEEFFDAATGEQIAKTIRRRRDEIEERVNPELYRKKKLPAYNAPASPAVVFERQADVLASAPVLRMIFKRIDPDRFNAAESRLLARRHGEATASEGAWRRLRRNGGGAGPR